MYLIQKKAVIEEKWQKSDFIDNYINYNGLDSVVKKLRWAE